MTESLRRRAAVFSWSELASIAVGRMAEGFLRPWQRYHALRRDLRCTGEARLRPLPVFPIDELPASGIRNTAIPHLADAYSHHQFDLLGSGWITWNRPVAQAAGDMDREAWCVIADLPPAFLPRSWELWRQVSAGYRPVDWHRDPHHGYRFSPNCWWRDALTGIPAGADPKLPWELGRLQHLPRMLLAALAQPDRRTMLCREVQDQIFDFLARNPPGLGIQWACPMDVAIRGANLAVSIDWLRQLVPSPAQMEPAWTALADALLDHGRFVAAQLEWRHGRSDNHYLAGICGLAFMSAILISTAETDGWYAFALQELIHECRRQFRPDGGHFESSSGYHRLAGEMLAWTAALYLGAGDEERKRLIRAERNPSLPRLLPRGQRPCNPDSDLLPPCFVERLVLAGEMTRALAGPDGLDPQIGDHDSGRFFCFSPLGRWQELRQGRESAFEEIPVDHRCFPAAVDALTLGRGKGLCPARQLEQCLIGMLARGRTLCPPQMPGGRPMPEVSCPGQRFLHRRLERFSDPGDGVPLNQDGGWQRWPDSGIYLYRSRRVRLLLTITPTGQHGRGGHAHDDLLSLLLWIDGRQLLFDAGSGRYLGDRRMRERFRSAGAHSVPEALDRHDQATPDGVFEFYDRARGQLLQLGRDRLLACRQGADGHFHRQIRITARALLVMDEADRPFQCHWNRGRFRSEGYGRILSDAYC